MSSVKRWRDTDHLPRAVDTAGGQEDFDTQIGKMLDHTRGWRLAELRKGREMTPEQVATRMGVSVSRVSQIEAGDVSTQEVLSRYITALGRTLKLIATSATNNSKSPDGAAGSRRPAARQAP